MPAAQRLAELVILFEIYIDAHARTEVCALNLGIVTYIRTATLDRIQEQRGSHHFPILYSKPLTVGNGVIDPLFVLRD